MMYQHTTKNKKNKENPAKHEDKTIIPTHLSLAMETLTSNFPESYLLLFLFCTRLYSGKVHHLLASLIIFDLFVFGCAGSSLLCGLFSIVMASGGCSVFVVCRLLTVMASLVAGHRR